MGSLKCDHTFSDHSGDHTTQKCDHTRDHGRPQATTGDNCATTVRPPLDLT